MKKRVLVSVLFALLLTGCHEHAYAPANCYNPATCTECGKTQGEKLGHSYGKATCETPATCARCGSTMGKALDHTWVEATCDTPKTCSTCGKIEGEALGHDSTEATCLEAAVCKRCGKQIEAKLLHDYTDGGCTSDYVCKMCGDVIKAPGHKFSKATCEEPKICERCKETEGEPLGHDIVDGKCSRCGVEMSPLDTLKAITNLQAGCEINYGLCVVDADISPSEGNPYDVVFDYGAQYNAMVESCDWSLIYDDKYYMEQYPVLAKLYHYEKELLLRHFQTVGIHEGRQASKGFSVAAYMDNCAADVKAAFGDDYAPYAMYYMLNYDTEKAVEHTKLKNGKTPAKQQKVILTVMQAKELKEINNYRQEVGAKDLIIDAEMCAFANYRAWVNAHDDWAGHDWAKQNNQRVWDILLPLGIQHVGENTVTVHHLQNRGEAKYRSYYGSKEHYDALISKKYNYFGTSHFYNSLNENLNNTEWKGKNVSCTFDCFADGLHTAYNK